MPAPAAIRAASRNFSARSPSWSRTIGTKKRKSPPQRPTQNPKRRPKAGNPAANRPPKSRRRKNPPPKNPLRAARQRRKRNGSEGQSHRLASGHQPDLGLALVRRQEGVWQAPPGRHQ